MTGSGAALNVGVPLELILGAGMGSVGAGRILSVALGMSLEVAGLRRRERNLR